MPIHPGVAARFHLLEGITSFETAFADPVLRASGEAFTAALAIAGVDIRQVLIDGMLHGFLTTGPDLAPVDRALGLLADLVAGGDSSG